MVKKIFLKKVLTSVETDDKISFAVAEKQKQNETAKQRTNLENWIIRQP